MRVVTKRQALFDETPMTWFPVRNEGGGRSASVVCENGHRASLWEHEIEASGRVVPSLECPVEGCGFHEYVRLEGWTQEPTDE